jgi:aryl-alcohol dehydrogenase-like predicted oxidoreductase
MKYLKLGPSGLIVSQFCLGAWHLPGAGSRDESGVERVDEDEFRRIVKRAYDAGINFVDESNRYNGRMSTADVAHVGNSEKILGRIIKDYERESWVIATKVRGKMADWPNGEGLSRKHIMWQIRESLKRLNLEHIDLYQIHWEDPRTPMRETLATLNNLIDGGLVRYIGESNHSAQALLNSMSLAEKLGLEGFVSMQEPYNLLERQIEKDKTPAAKKFDLTLMAYVPLAQGVLSGKYLQRGVESGSRASYTQEMADQYLNEETKNCVRSLQEFAKEKGISLPQLGLAWMLHKQEELGISIVPILGITKQSYLDDNLASLEVKLSGSDMRQLEEIASKAKMGPQSY